MAFKKTLPAALLILVFVSSLFATEDIPKKTKAYIDTYSIVAIEEMQRSGIPASIILAQGIQESSWGSGELAANSNNHFGIKCKKDWSGDTYFIEDDDRDKYGKLIKSCFRVYNSVYDSYADHSDFLMDNPRYAPLFNLDKKDYTNWAKGLKECGYATDPLYADKLIQCIKKYDLQRFDDLNESAAIAESVEIQVPALEPTPSINSIESVPPPAYSIPSDYQRGAGLKETPIEAIIEENTAVIVREENTGKTQPTLMEEIITSKVHKDNLVQLGRKPRTTNSKRR